MESHTNHGSISGMTTLEFLSVLRERQVQIQAQDGLLKISAPAGAIDAVLRAELKRRKPALLHAVGIVAPSLKAGTEIVPLTSEELRGRIPLTPAQEGMWLIDHFTPGDAAYNIPEAFRIEERIALETLQGAVDRLLERHSILRTSFHEEDGELFQTIAPSVKPWVGFTDLSALADEESERSCRALIRSEGRRAFDLKQAPLVRFHLFRLAERRHVIFYNMHHIVSDRRSLYVIREDLLALIRSCEEQTDAALPAIPMHFADYAAWTAGRMHGEAMERQVEYWKKKLAGLPAYLPLPHSRAWPEKRSSVGATKRVFVSAAARTALNRVGTEVGASPFMTFLALFAVAMARWSPDGGAGDAVDFSIGSPITHRKQPATERMIGLFVNMLAFRCRIEPGMSFRDVLCQVRGTALEAYENSDVPFRRLVREINPDRRLQCSPIFQVMFGYEPYQSPVADEFQMDADPGTARYDFSLHLCETANEGLTGTVEYSADLFEETEIDGFLALSGDVVAGIVRDADQDVFGIPALSKRPSGKDSLGSASAEEAPAAISGSKAGSGVRVLRKLSRLFSL